MGKCNFILFVVVVPYVHPAILPGQEEGTHSGGGKTPITDVAIVVFGLYDGSFHLVHPQHGPPVSQSHENLWVLEIPCN